MLIVSNHDIKLLVGNNGKLSMLQAETIHQNIIDFADSLVSFFLFCLNKYNLQRTQKNFKPEGKRASFPLQMGKEGIGGGDGNAASVEYEAALLVQKFALLLTF